ITRRASFDDWFQPLITPSRPAKRKTDGPPAITKLLVWLRTMPVGWPDDRKLDPGTDTTSENGFPVASYNVDVPVQLVANHRMPVGPNAIPHGLTRFRSIVAPP